MDFFFIFKEMHRPSITWAYLYVRNWLVVVWLCPNRRATQSLSFLFIYLFLNHFGSIWNSDNKTWFFRAVLRAFLWSCLIELHSIKADRVRILVRVEVLHERNWSSGVGWMHNDRNFKKMNWFCRKSDTRSHVVARGKDDWPSRWNSPFGAGSGAQCPPTGAARSGRLAHQTLVSRVQYATVSAIDQIRRDRTQS